MLILILRGDIVKKYLAYIFAFIFVLLIVILFVNKSNVKYSLDDCVTYFDEEGRYQLIEIEDYFIVDKKDGVSLFPCVTQYAFHENIVYAQYNEFIGYSGEPHNNTKMYACRYGTFDVVKGEKKVVKRIEEFPTEVQNIFNDNDIMIRLNPDKNNFERWIMNFIPTKYRKR